MKIYTITERMMDHIVFGESECIYIIYGDGKDKHAACIINNEIYHVSSCRNNRMLIEFTDKTPGSWTCWGNILEMNETTKKEITKMIKDFVE